LLNSSENRVLFLYLIVNIFKNLDQQSTFQRLVEQRSGLKDL